MVPGVGLGDGTFSILTHHLLSSLGYSRIVFSVTEAGKLPNIIALLDWRWWQVNKPVLPSISSVALIFLLGVVWGMLGNCKAKSGTKLKTTFCCLLLTPSLPPSARSYQSFNPDLAPPPHPRLLWVFLCPSWEGSTTQPHCLGDAITQCITVERRCPTWPALPITVAIVHNVSVFFLYQYTYGSLPNPFVCVRFSF